MKHNYMLILSIAVFLSVFAMLSGQPVSVVIGTSTTTQDFPFGASDGFERSASLYLASEIGITGNLSTISFFVGGSDTDEIPSKVYLKTTTATSLTSSTWATMISGATLAYDFYPTFQATGWVTINIKDFTLPSGQNLLVLCESNFGGSGPTTWPTFRFTTSANRHQAWTQNTTPPTGNGTVNSNRPNITLTFLAKTYPTNPRHIAQYEPAIGAIIRYPLGIPYTLVRDLADDDQLFCVVSSGNQAAAITAFTSNGVNMTNVQWIIADSQSYWTRDWGPISIYEDGVGGREIKLVDFQYDRLHRPQDNLVNAVIANYLGIGYYTMDLTLTGGNIMTDGLGLEFSDNFMIEENLAQGQSGIESEWAAYCGATDYHFFQDPTGTYIHHIDTYAKVVAVDKVIVARVATGDSRYAAFEAIAAQFAGLTSSLGTPYTVYRVTITGAEAYTNSFILNDEVYVPFMTNTANNNAALAVYQSAMPGYLVRGYTGATGTPWVNTDAIHCRVNTVFASEEEPPLPIELSSFTATLSATNYVTLNWVTQSETNVAGFRIYRSLTEDVAEAEMLNVFIPGSNTSQMQSYVYQDTEIYEDGTYYYWLENQDMDGSSGLYGPVSVQVQLSFDPGTPPIPIEKGIASVYPNPFSPATTIKYGLQTRGEVTLDVYNLKGQLVRHLVTRVDEPGYHTIQWNGLDNSGNQCTSGMYYITLRNGSEYFTRKALLVK